MQSSENRFSLASKADLRGHKLPVYLHNLIFFDKMPNKNQACSVKKLKIEEQAAIKALQAVLRIRTHSLWIRIHILWIRIRAWKFNPDPDSGWELNLNSYLDPDWKVNPDPDPDSGWELNLDSDPDPGWKLNSDPDPDPDPR